MEILVPKYLAADVLPEAEFQEFWRLIDVQGLRQFISLRERYYPRFVAAAYTTSGNNPHGTWDEFDKLEAAEFLNLGPAVSGKYSVSRMSTTHRLLLYMVSYVLLPRKRNHGTATEEDLPIIWAMAQGKQINWPYLIAHKMVKYSRGAMRRNLLGPADEGGDDEDEAMEDVPPTFEAGTSSHVPTEAEAPPQFQSDYAELIQRRFDDMRTLMSEGFSSLSDRMDRLDLRMTGQSAEIQDLRGEFRSFRDSFQRSGHQEQQDPAPGQD
ncbi:hypothetical protein PIB30_106572 [Stylosanthes scabra]|uniref:Uncharacterized protein n=1 Tax=Stylosanthes scabra TaxID=79078 RepID=A0ABU6ZXM6_9FABA|nr:hypothetical protein [Stylosanthes scabra]